jgi:hypothetical protein
MANQAFDYDSIVIGSGLAAVWPRIGLPKRDTGWP